MFIGSCQELEAKLRGNRPEAQTQRPDFGGVRASVDQINLVEVSSSGASGAHGFFEVCLCAPFSPV